MSAAPIADVAQRAADAAAAFGSTPYALRTRLLDLVADRLDADAARLAEIAHRETHLTMPRLTGEVARTTYQLRSFARLLEGGEQLGIVIEHAHADFPLGASPDLRRILQPVGPVLVFAASNFPFAFSVAGGDTASALAAGCPVVVKAHPGHPELSREVAAIIAAAVAELGLPDGVFQLIEGEAEGVEMLRDPRIQAASFTGSTAGGRFLFDVAASRPQPIPFYGELGSVNPVYVTAEALAERRDEIAQGFVGSFTLGAGQFCTKPGIVLVPHDDALVERIAQLIDDVAPAPLLNDRIASTFERLGDDFRRDGVTVVRDGGITPEGPAPALFLTSASTFLAEAEALSEERFGPSALLVTYDDPAELPRIADAIGGTLTSTLQASTAGDAGLDELIAATRRHSGRILWNGWPTGVTVSPAMTHGGPYPSSTTSAHTSVGLTAIGRFLRPVTFQGFPDAALPAELVDADPLGLSRTVDGERRAGA